MDLADGSPRYRVVAAEAHSWTTLVLMSEHGDLATYNTQTGRLAAVAEDEVNRLLAARVYRRWHGSADLAPLDRLPIAGRVSVPEPMVEHSLEHDVSEHS